MMRKVILLLLLGVIPSFFHAQPIYGRIAKTAIVAKKMVVAKKAAERAIQSANRQISNQRITPIHTQTAMNRNVETLSSISSKHQQMLQNTISLRNQLNSQILRKKIDSLQVYNKAFQKYDERFLNMYLRFLSYVNIESQSVDEPSMSSFPMTDGQKRMAQYIYNEVLKFEGENVKIYLSDDYYLYIDIPSNINKEVPSILFMAHMDVTPEAPGVGIKPLPHFNYNGEDIVLPSGLVLSPNTPHGSHLKDLIGKTIITSDGTTLLGADDKTGCAVLITMVEEIIKNPDFKHGRVMVLLSQNEDVGKAATRYDPNVFEKKPDIVIDVDGDTYNKFSIANFTAVGQNYYFKGNKAHPNDGKKNHFADALSAATFFMGLVPPELNPSAREGEEGYIHCYYLNHPLNSVGKPITSDYVVKVRLRYFDQREGEIQQKLMDENLRKVQEAFPFVVSSMTDNGLQYQNIAYSMPHYVPDLIKKASKSVGMKMESKKSRGGTTSAMMAARFPNEMPGGSDVYSGQNAEHSCYEWCCIEEMLQLVDFTKKIITDVRNLK